MVEDASGGYDSSAAQVPGSVGQLWSTSATAGQCSTGSNCRGHGWDPNVSNNDPYDNDVSDDYAGPWDIYQYGRVIDQGRECDDYSGYSNSRCNACNGYRDRCTTEYCYCWRSNPNTSCPWAYIQPLTSNEQTLLNLIQTMKHEGSTYSNVGMAWGMRLLSPAPPFTEGTAWDDDEWNKAIVMMTDGEMSPSSIYSYYWDSRKTYTDSVSTLNNRLTETCNLLKSNDVIIYTVTFDHATSDISESTKNIYRGCATSPDHYYDAPSQEELTNVFEEISAALARLHISN